MRRPVHTALARVLLAALLLASERAHAEGAADPAATAARVEFLRTLLDSESQAATRWTWGWAGAYGVVTVAQVAPIAFISDPGTRTDLWVGSISSLMGAVGIAVAPLNLPDGQNLPTDPALALREAERRLHLGAEKERAGTAWYLHAANVAVNLVLGLVLGIGWGHWDSAAISFGVGVLAGEVTLFTQPTRLIAAEQAWNAGVHPLSSAVTLVPTLGPHGPGLALSLSW